MGITVLDRLLLSASALANPGCAMDWHGLTAIWVDSRKVPLQGFALFNTKQNFSAEIITSKQAPDLHSAHRTGEQHSIHTTSFLNC